MSSPKKWSVKSVNNVTNPCFHLPLYSVTLCTDYTVHYLGDDIYLYIEAHREREILGLRNILVLLYYRQQIYLV